MHADPAFKMAGGQLPESGTDLCSQRTISRSENPHRPAAVKRMMTVTAKCTDKQTGEVVLVVSTVPTDKFVPRIFLLKSCPVPHQRLIKSCAEYDILNEARAIEVVIKSGTCRNV